MSLFGNKLKINIFGESHGKAIGVCIDGFPAGFHIDMEKLNSFMKRRMPGQNNLSTPRKESDSVEFLSGVVNNITCGSTICAVIKNTDQHSQDYNNLLDIPRPSHSDYPAYIKFGGNNDIRGGGNFSGRLTAPLCIAGGLCMQYLNKKNIYIGAHISSVHGTYDDMFDKVKVSEKDFVGTKNFPVINDEKGEIMIKEILNAKSDGDSVGGTIECAIIGMPTGYGNSLFDGVDGMLAAALFGIPAVKGVEFGSGFNGTELYGSENNDEFYFDDDIVKTKTNNHGGILGGITSSMPIIFNVAIKPTPSIAKEQNSISISKKENVKFKVTGRHDPCIVQRAVPCIEAASAICMTDIILRGEI